MLMLVSGASALVFVSECEVLLVQMMTHVGTNVPVGA